MPKPKVVIVDRLAPLLLGSMLCGGGLLHMWYHSQWGTADWGVVAIIVRAWRGTSTKTDEHEVKKD